MSRSLTAHVVISLILIILAIVVALILLLCCCMVGRRRKFARRQNPAVKPPLFGSAPPGYSMYALPFWNNNNKPGQNGANAPSQYGTSVYGQQSNYDGQGATGTASQNTGGYQPPSGPPPRNNSEPPPPPYGKAAGTDTNENYAPVCLIIF